MIDIYDVFKIPTKTAEEPFVTSSQKAAIEVIKNYFWSKQIDTKESVIAPRLVPLLVGKSGTGKSYCVAEAARQLGLPLYHIGLSDWSIRNSVAKAYTLDVLHEFVRSNSAGIVFLDEVDKLRSSSVQNNGWWQSVAVEVFAFLDAKGALAALNWSEEALENLRSHLVVGAGSWQEALTNDQRVVGFGEQHKASSLKSRVEKASQIPFEILARFSPKLIEIKQPTHEDFKKGFSLILKEYGFTKCFEEKLGEMAANAVEQGRGARGLEHFATLLALRQARRKFSKGFPAFNLKNPIPTIHKTECQRSPDFHEKVNQLNQKCDAVAKLAIGLAVVMRQFPSLNKAKMDLETDVDKMLDTLADNLIYFARCSEKTFRKATEELIKKGLGTLLEKIRQNRDQYLDKALSEKAALFYAEAAIWYAEYEKLIGMI